MSSNPWLFAGPASSFPNIQPASADSSTSTTGKQPKTSLRASSSYPPDADAGLDVPPPPCKIIQCSPQNSNDATEVTADEAQVHIGSLPQVLIFRYRDRFHAVDHACPHRTYPLSRGSIYDIEDFGIILSAGITCPGHGWAFDLFTGESDRGSYRLSVWDVELRKGEEEGNEEVWVRRKEKRRRIG